MVVKDSFYLAVLKSLPLVGIFNRASKGRHDLRQRFYKIGWKWTVLSDARRVQLLLDTWQKLIAENPTAETLLHGVTGQVRLSAYLIQCSHQKA